MHGVGTAFFRSHTEKCPNCGDFARQEDEYQRCPACHTVFTEYLVLQEGQPLDLENN